MGVLPACVSVLQVHTVLTEARKNIRSPGSTDTDGCELSCGYWDLNRVSWENNQCSKPLNNLSSPTVFFIIVVIIIDKSSSKLGWSTVIG